MVDSCQMALGQLQTAVELQNQLSHVDSLPAAPAPGLWQTAVEFQYQLIQVDSLAMVQGQLQTDTELQNPVDTLRRVLAHMLTAKCPDDDCPLMTA